MIFGHNIDVNENIFFEIDYGGGQLIFCSNKSCQI